MNRVPLPDIVCKLLALDGQEYRYKQQVKARIWLRVLLPLSRFDSTGGSGQVAPKRAANYPTFNPREDGGPGLANRTPVNSSTLVSQA